MTRIRLVFLGFVLLVGCGELSRTPGAEDGGAGAHRIYCENCLAGISGCFDGECHFLCNTEAPGQACVLGFHCEPVFGYCVPDRVASCQEEPCTDAQQCRSDYCVVVSSRTCSRSTECTASEHCAASGACVSLPQCDADGTCRVGTQGAVCNRVGPDDDTAIDTRVDPGRCLTGRCATNDHCPAPLTCQDLGAEVAGLGVCR